MKLTPKQEKFAQEVAKGKTQADAYRASFAVRPNTKPESVQQSASKLMADPKVSSRVEELRERVAAKVGITLESHLAALAELSKRAAEENQFSAAISAEVARGKASGIYIDKHEITGKGGAPIQQTNLTPEEFRKIAKEVTQEF